jgi:pre-mRNA-splicing factor RBM22/SLT11
MPPQIKHDLNRSGWETTDLPSVCERCLPQNNPYVQMLKEDYGEACKLCTRPFTVFRWKADRTSRQKRTGICLTCARLKNCCQCCMLDIQFGLPISIRDAALKMVAPGPQSEVNREYYAQNNEREIEEGRGLEGYEKSDEKARELLRRLAQSEPYYKKQRRLEAEGAGEGGQKLLEGGEQQLSEPGPIRTKDSRERKSAYGSAYGNAARSSVGSKPPAKRMKATPIKPEDILPPRDTSVTSLFVTGVEDDLPEHAIRTYFTQYGALRSLVCSHRSHCAFINYMSRDAAEEAAAACQGRAIVQGVPLRVQWGKPKPLDSLDRDQRLENAKAGRAVAAGSTTGGAGKRKAIEGPDSKDEDWDGLAASVAPPPGLDEGVEYAALAGE